MAQYHQIPDSIDISSPSTIKYQTVYHFIIIHHLITNIWANWLNEEQAKKLCKNENILGGEGALFTHSLMSCLDKCETGCWRCQLVGAVAVAEVGVEDSVDGLRMLRDTISAYFSTLLNNAGLPRPLSFWTYGSIFFGWLCKKRLTVFCDKVRWRSVSNMRSYMSQQIRNHHITNDAY